MTAIESELSTQPACWRAAVSTAHERAASLPSRAQRVAVVGCGTSGFVAQAYALLREEGGHGATDAFVASQFPFGRRYDLVVAITRSGTTTELLDVLTRLDPSTRTLLLTTAHDTPAEVLATDAIVLDFAAERSVVATRSATTTLALLRAGLGHTLDGAIDEAGRAVREPLPVDVGAYRQFTFLGSGWAAGVANEAALKCREAAGVWAESYPALEYRHGPISASGADSAVFVFGPPPAGLADDIAATGATVVQSGRDPMADVVWAQRLAVALAARNGRDPDRPPSLAYSVVLDPSVR